jgi:hypothetical protein
MAKHNIVRDLKQIKERIDNLSLDGKKEIFKIIKDNGEHYSENKNGVLLDITRFNNDTLEKIRTFLNFSEDKQKTLNNDEESRDNFRSLLV